MSATKTTIQAIKKFDNPNQWLGYKIVMSDTTKNIVCKIDNEHICCEKWGVYVKTELEQFIGAEYYSVHIGKINRDDDDEMTTLNITINTNKGPIDILFYNQHNTYYPHDVYIKTKIGITNIQL